MVLEKHKALVFSFRDGAKSGDARTRHFSLLLEIIQTADSMDLSLLPLYPVRDGPIDEFEDRFAQVKRWFSMKLKSDPSNPHLLRNYCRFLSRDEPHEALQLADRLVLLEPQNARNHNMNAQIRKQIVRETKDDVARSRENERIFQSLKTEVAIRGDDWVAKNYTLIDLCWTAYRLGHAEEAVDAALRCISAYKESLGPPPKEIVRVDVFCSAHMLLGLLALDREERDTAKKHLQESVDLPPSALGEIDDLPPDLARRLLDSGDRDAVRRFLEKVSSVRCAPGLRELHEAFTATNTGREE